VGLTLLASARPQVAQPTQRSSFGRGFNKEHTKSHRDLA